MYLLKNQIKATHTTYGKLFKKSLCQSWANTNHQAHGLLSSCDLNSPVHLWDLSTLPKRHLQTGKIPSNETSSNPEEQLAELVHKQWSSLHKDGEPRNHHDMPLTLRSQTPCPNARHLPTQTNPLLRACIWQETTWSPTSLIQGSAQKHLAWGQKLIQLIGKLMLQKELIREE